MNSHTLKRLILANSRGSVLVLVGVLLFVFIGIAALAIDIGYLSTTRNELQNVADAAALSGARVLGKIYQGDVTLTPIVEPMSYADQQTYDCSSQLTFSSGTYGITGVINDCEFIIEQASQTALQNEAAGAAELDVTIRTEDILIGTWDGNFFATGTSQPDAVSVRARRDNFTKPIVTFFANIFNIDAMNVSAMATAALTGMGSAAPGELELPIGIPDTVFDKSPAEWCQTDIKFSPPTATDVCGGFTDFEPDNSVNPNGLNNLIDGETDSPGITAGKDVVAFNNGSSNVYTYEALLTAYETKGYDVDAAGNPRVDVDGNPVGPGVDLNLAGIGPAVPLTEQNPYYDPVDPVGDITPQLRYPPCSGGSGSCSGGPRYRHIWETGIVVYDSTAMTDPCIPNKPAKIVGFAEIRIKDVLTAPDKYIVGELLCDYIGEGDNRGGGGTFGVKGPIPGLVQ